MSFRRTPRAMHWACSVLVLAAPTAAQIQWTQRTSGNPVPRYRHGLAYDEARGECLLFSGAPSPEQDTWVWDGVLWEQRFPAASPSPQTGYAFAYDSLREVVVLYGRDEFGGQTPETFEWDGAAWHDRTPLVKPSNRDRSAMAFDAARGVSVLFGGHFFFTPKADTWEWNGTSWTARTPLTTSPPARAYHCMVYDEARARVLLYGGFGTSALLGDTWEWDGSDWTQRAPPVSPPPRELAAMAYDSVRQVAVLHGGYAPGLGALQDTWEWDGATWSQRFPAHAPPPLFDHAMAFDSARARTVLVGGTAAISTANGTWEWDGNDWQRVPTGPPARQRHSLAFDAARGRTVMFGGFHDPAFLGDTWEWDGLEWIHASPGVPPPSGTHHRLFAGRPEGRIETALAFDSVRRTTVMFGGQGRDVFDDTWEWDGSTWVERLAPVRPPSRHGHALAYDELRGRVVLFGGHRDMFTPSLADTWEWDGRAWEQRFPVHSPPGREDLAMAWDAARGRVVLFGGESCPPFSGCAPLDDTWEWDGTDWRLAASGGPPPRAYHALAFDRNRSRLVLSGGLGFSGSLADEWEWDGTAWLERSIPGPSARHGHALTFDARRGRVVLFGGTDDGGRVDAETWELFAPCDVVGEGHDGGGLALSCTTSPRIGTSLCLAFDDPAGTGAHALLAARGPCLATPILVGGPSVCAPALVHLVPEVAWSGATLPALRCGPIPPDPGLVGATFCFQGAAREAGGCWRLTDAISVTIQP